MKYLFTVILSLILIFPVLALASDTDSHTVTVQVLEINEIDVDNDLILTIDSATAGDEPDDAMDSTTCDLCWTTNATTTKKITVDTSLLSPTYTLKVVAINITGVGTAVGTAAAEVTLSTTGPNDFITSISQTTGICDLQYTASATAAQGIGSDVHTVTYTILDSA